jgi:hypothetical protein
MKGSRRRGQKVIEANQNKKTKKYKRHKNEERRI